MKLSCLQENLNKGLNTVGRAVAVRATLPITTHILLATDQSRLKLSATNLEIAISCWIGAKVESEGAITLPARLLTEFVSALPNDRVDLALTGRSLQLKCARSEARISGMDSEDFPPIPKVSDSLSTKIEAEDLRNAIAQVHFAAATEDTRPVLTGVHTEMEGTTLTLAAADGFRLAVHSTKLITPVAEKTSVIIPARALAELNRLIMDQEEPVEIALNLNKSQVLFRLKSTEMVSQLIQGTFPNYAQLIPQRYTTRAVLDVAEFQRATRTASIFARDGSGIVRLQITPGEGVKAGKMTISAQAEEVGDNTSEIDATVDGEATKIAFNSKYLSDVLGVIRQGQIALETTSSSSPGVLKPVGQDNYVHVVMPMFVQW